MIYQILDTKYGYIYLTCYLKNLGDRLCIMENQKRGPFAQQQADLTNAFENLRESTQQKINLIMDNHISDDTPMKNFRPELDKQIETLHLMVSSYFGDCDRRKQRIEAVISEQVDVSGFKEIGAALCS